MLLAGRRQRLPGGQAFAQVLQRSFRQVITSRAGGNREHAKLVARAAVASGVAGVFLETHEDPDNAPSDGPNMIKLSDMGDLLTQLKAIDRVVKGY